MVTEQSHMPWVIFQLHGSSFGIHSSHVREIVPDLNTTSIPNAPKQVRGVMNLRGQIVPVLDARLAFGLRSLDQECDELNAMLQQREEDHRNWLKELESCILENRAFRMATDPHKCAFGKWFDAYKSPSSAVMIQLMRFDGPHKAIHGVAQKVLGLCEAGQQETAQAIINRTRQKELASMIALFDEFRLNVRSLQREVAIVLSANSHQFAVTADSATSAEDLKDIQDQPASGEEATTKGITFRIGKRPKDETLVLLPNIEELGRIVHSGGFMGDGI